MLVKEYSENLLLWKSNFIINVTKVNVDTYSTSAIGTVGRADILIKTQGVVMKTEKTVFNIMNHTELRLNENLSEDRMTTDEISISNDKFYF